MRKAVSLILVSFLSIVLLIGATPAKSEAFSPQRIGHRALMRIASKMHTEKLDVTIQFAGRSPYYLGLYEPEIKKITIYIRRNQSLNSVAWVLAHELAHAIDFTKISFYDRKSWAEARNYSVDLWWPQEGASNDFNSGAGDFAECVATWIVGVGLPFRSALGPKPTPTQIHLLNHLVNY
jgi:hypothetical protein